MYPSNAEVTQLDAETIERIHNHLPPGFKQGHRMVDYLNENPRSLAVAVQTNCSISNLSHVRRITNRFLWEFKVQIGCEYPNQVILNRFDEPSNQWLWSIYKPIENRRAANDPNFDLGETA